MTRIATEKINITSGILRRKQTGREIVLDSRPDVGIVVDFSDEESLKKFRNLGSVGGTLKIKTLNCSSKDVMTLLNESWSLDGIWLCFDFEGGNSALNGTESALDVLGRELKHNRYNITNIEVRNALDGDMIAESLAKALRHNALVQELSLNGVCLTNRGLSALCKALEGRDNLRRLSLKSNDINDEDGDEWANDLRLFLFNNPKLTGLDLCDNRISCESLLKITMGNGTIESLNIGSTFVDDLEVDSVDKLLADLAKNTTLRNLDLSNNSMDGHCIKVFLSNLAQNSNLKSLRLDDNSFNYDGFKKIFEILRGRPGMNLLLKNCDMDSNGFKNLIEVLSSGLSLGFLDLSDNKKIGESGFSCLRESLGDEKLESLMIRDIDIDDESLQTLFKWVKRNVHLRHLGIERGLVKGRDFGALLNETLKENFTIEGVDFLASRGDNFVLGDKDGIEIAKSLYLAQSLRKGLKKPPLEMTGINLPELDLRQKFEICIKASDLIKEKRGSGKRKRDHCEAEVPNSYVKKPKIEEVGVDLELS